jgi:hypothetical protein
MVEDIELIKRACQDYIERLSAQDPTSNFDKVLHRIGEYILGGTGVYDSSVLDLLPVDLHNIQGKSILDIAAGDLGSTLDLLSYEPTKITVIEPYPFGGASFPSGGGFTETELEQLLELKKGHLHLPIERIRFWQHRLGIPGLGDMDEIPADNEYAFCFFPNPNCAGGTSLPSISWDKDYPSWEGVFGYGLKMILEDKLCPGGKCYIITEVTDPYICDVARVGVNVTSHQGGEDPTYPNKNLKIIRPISRLNLKIVEYVKE